MVNSGVSQKGRSAVKPTRTPTLHEVPATKKEKPSLCGWALQMVEVGGIEPPSEGTPSPALHA